MRSMTGTRKQTAAIAGAALIVLAVSIRPSGTQRERTPRLDDVLARAGEYAVEYGRALSSVVAEEHYTQRLVWRTDKAIRQVRRLRSEIAFVRLADSTEWLTFRNVLSVDDVPVPGAGGRLERLLRGASPSMIAQARIIAGESARYNIGPITREINTPTTALHFVHPTHRPNCRFDKAREDVIDGERVWVVRFRERNKGSLIRRGDGVNLPAVGLLWIGPTDGHVVRSQLVVEDFVRGSRDSKSAIDVTWRRNASLALWVPAEMREQYEGPWRSMRTPRQRERYDIDGVATYANYRRFTVDVRIK